MGIDVNKYAGDSKWLKAKDLIDQDMDVAIVTICEVFEETFEARDGKPAEDRLCVRFKEFEKALGLNVTNTKAILSVYDEDTDDWIGKKMKLRVSTTQMPGSKDPVDCLRLAPPPTKAKVGDAAKSKPKPEDVDDPYADE